MNAVPFDTLKMAQRLEAAGFPAPQAAGASEALAEALVGADLATKADIAAVKADIAGVKADIVAVRSDIAGNRAQSKSEIAGVRADFKTDIAGVKAELKADI